MGVIKSKINSRSEGFLHNQKLMKEVVADLRDVTLDPGGLKLLSEQTYGNHLIRTGQN